MLVYLQYILPLVLKKGKEEEVKEEETKMLLCQGSKLKTMTAKIQPFFHVCYRLSHLWVARRLLSVQWLPLSFSSNQEAEQGGGLASPPTTSSVVARMRGRKEALNTNIFISDEEVRQ